MTSTATLMPWSESETYDNEQRLRQLTKEIVRLFGEWQLNFGHKAPVKNYPVQKAVLWAKVILHIQPTAEQWRLAKEHSLFEEWPPSSARDLLALAPVNNPCYPDMHQAYIDAAVNQEYTHAVVYKTARRVGFWDLKSKPEAVTYKRWQQLYSQVCYEHEKCAMNTKMVQILPYHSQDKSRTSIYLWRMTVRWQQRLMSF